MGLIDYLWVTVSRIQDQDSPANEAPEDRILLHLLDQPGDMGEEEVVVHAELR